MKKQADLKHLVCVTVAAATVFSLGCLALADEADGIDESVDQSETIVVDGEEDIVLDAVEVEETVTDEASDVTIPENGWYFDNNYNYWFFYEDGKRVTGWKEIDGKWYYFQTSSSSYNNGRMYLGLRKDEEYETYYLFGPSGYMLKGWQRFNNDWYYFHSNGKAAIGWIEISGKWYYFSESGQPKMQTGYRQIDGDYYMLDPITGAMVQGWSKVETYNGSFSYRYFLNTGKAASGWLKIGGKYYFFNSDSDHFMRTGAVKDPDSNDYYVMGTDGVMVTGGWYNTYVVTFDGETYYSGDWYYLDKDGKAVRGFQQIGGKWYYFMTSGDPYMYRDGLRSIDGDYYFFDYETGVMCQDGWKKVGYNYSTSEDYNWYYFNKSGKAQRGWLKSGGKYYYFGGKSDTPYMRINSYIYDSESEVYYYVGSDGAMCTGWFKNYNDKYSYANTKGECATGWQTIGGKTYYFNYRQMVTGYRYIDGTLYYFGTDGVCRNAPKG